MIGMAIDIEAINGVLRTDYARKLGLFRMVERRFAGVEVAPAPFFLECVEAHGLQATSR